MTDDDKPIEDFEAWWAYHRHVVVREAQKYEDAARMAWQGAMASIEQPPDTSLKYHGPYPAKMVTAFMASLTDVLHFSLQGLAHAAYEQGHQHREYTISTRDSDVDESGGGCDDV